MFIKISRAHWKHMMQSTHYKKSFGEPIRDFGDEFQVRSNQEYVQRAHRSCEEKVIVPDKTMEEGGT